MLRLKPPLNKTPLRKFRGFLAKIKPAKIGARSAPEKNGVLSCFTRGKRFKTGPKIGKNKEIDQEFGKFLAKIKPPEKKLADPDLKVFFLTPR